MERNQAIALAVEGNAEKQCSGKFSRGAALQTAGCAGTDRMVYWFRSLNIFASQLFGHPSDNNLRREEKPTRCH
jgi:hypothetical protein